MKLTYTIEDLDAIDYTVEFTFDKTIDGQIVFCGAWDIIHTSEPLAMPQIADLMVSNWLANGGEDKIYDEIERLRRIHYRNTSYNKLIW